MDNKEKKVLEEAKLLLYPTPNCVEYYQTVKATADEVVQKIFEAMSDYVPVVRCKDCRWFENDGYHTNCKIMQFCVEAEDYCSKGERRRQDV